MAITTDQDLAGAGSVARAAAPTSTRSATSSVGSGLGWMMVRDGDLKSALIMMIDDEPLNMAVVRTYLEDEGYSNFIITSEPAGAFDRMMAERPDCLLLDLVMPQVTGFDILSAARASEELGHLPVIVLTASDEPETKLRALKLGATDFLSKPVDPSELVLRLHNTLAVKAYQDRLRYLDPLTGLPNRRLLMEQLARLLGAGGGEAALLHFNVDRFKGINDALGHAAADGLLVEFAVRLRGEIAQIPFGPGCELLAARTGGDEFTVLVSADGALALAEALAARLVERVRDSVVVAGQELFLSASIGIAGWPVHATTQEELLARATIALSAAKADGGNRVYVFSDVMHRRSVAQLAFDTDLRRAVERGQLVLKYQPKIEASSGQVVGAEALLRWRHPELGLVSAGDIIPAAEEGGYIVEIGAWVLREAFTECRRWQAEGLGDLQLAVNLSAKQFSEPGLIGVLESALSQSGLAPELVTLEVTESLLMRDVERSIEIMREIKALGMLLSIDDFGTGYSSFSYLRRFPIDELKVDKAFVDELESQSSDVAIVRAVVAMTHALGLKAVAEGVETEGQRHALCGLECDVLQGYLFSRPLSPEDFVRFVANAQALRPPPG